MKELCLLSQQIYDVLTNYVNNLMCDYSEESRQHIINLIDLLVQAILNQDNK